ncbi:hypothetical protein SynRS9915_01304 [Synechococcus sp. RS9915]|nr:hypothetical protein SynRS9915_01304 [Synechococcus sp. RS9915]
MWDNFIRDQEYCEQFFFGREMRTYIIAKAWKQKYKLTWEQMDVCFESFESTCLDIDLNRKEDWFKVACFEYLAD